MLNISRFLLILTVIFINITNATIEWNGYLQTDNRLLFKDWSLSYQECRLSLQTNYKPNDNVNFFSEIWIRSIGFTNAGSSQDLSLNKKISPVELNLREAYLSIYGLFNKNLDLKIGRQRIAWGVADKLNPTDNLNPNDLEDIWDFGRHLASNSIKASYYLNNWSLTTVFIPTFTPATLPKSNVIASSLFQYWSLPSTFTYHNITDTLILPKNTLTKSSIYGAKLNSNLFNYDFSFSYIYGLYDLPLPNQIIFIPTIIPYQADLQIQLCYPRTHIFGFDIAGAIKNVGFWTEAAVYLPHRTILSTDLSMLGMGTYDSIILDNTPYVRYVIGLDYTFKNSIYVNGQYLHGFVFERGKENLEDYFMLGLEWKFLQDKIKLNPLNSAVEIKNWSEIMNNYAIILMPEISYYAFEGIEMTLGYRLIAGKSYTTFGQLANNDELYFKVKYCF